MSKTLVNIVTEDNPTPAYLFVKELYEIGDKLMLISAKDTEDDLEHLSEIIGVPENLIEEIVLKNDIDEFRYELICRTLKSHITGEGTYYVNLAGGTRYLALAVQQAFERYRTRFYYVNIEDNQIISSKFDDSIYDDDDYSYDIKHRMNIAEYLDIHDMEHNIGTYSHTPILPFEASKIMFEKFSQQEFRADDYQTMELLRENYRNKRFVRISELLHPSPKSKHVIVRIPHIMDFLGRIHFETRQKDTLTRCELEWLTGGWFEEYIYYLVKEAIQPDDICLGIKLWEEGVKRHNELDVTFIKNNKLFVIECKTGIQTEALFNVIVYKACALRESLLGANSHSYIFTLKDDDKDVLMRIAENMDIQLVDKEILCDKTQLSTVWKGMLSIANEIHE